MFSGLFASLISSSTMTIQDFTAIYEDKLKIETLQKFNSYSNSVDDKGTLTLTELFDLEFRDVSFKYPNTNKYVLENISFKITKMENICFIGSNGSGKSTIIKLLLRFYDATNGEILINNINIKNYSISSLRSAFSVAFQKYINYAFSLRENIKLSSLQDQYWTDIEAYKALELVGSEEFISKLPKGLDTYLHKIFDADGYEASSGEYQKIALARAMNKKCEVLILDEPTASFDPTSEYELYRNLNNKNMNRTTIFISHRLSMVHLCDRIIMMESGRITGIGNHSDLMSSNTKYAELYNLQASAYK